jgi:tRNA A-37 threonylcarbamoyl transferase component Bud32
MEVNAACKELTRVEVLVELGRGGAGVVFQARQHRPQRLVALKILRNDAGREEQARFRAEAEAAARLQHPAIVPIYEVGEHDGQPFFSMEFVEGGSLSRHLADGPWTARRAAELVETVARAVQHAHEGNILHRDLKPANILLDGAGQPRIADFGLAKCLDADVHHTHTGQVLGTPSYMAPEQAQGNRDVGPAVDVYALGAILYELLVGRPPFRAATPVETLVQVVHTEPIPPRRLNSAVPRDLETISLKCLEKGPGFRYASAQALADDLRRFLDGRATVARPLSAPARLWRWARRRPSTAALALALLLVTVLGVLTAGWQWREALASARAEATARQDAEAQARSEANARRQVERLLAGALVDQATNHADAGDVALGLHEFMEALEHAAGDPDLERVCRCNLASWFDRVVRERAALKHSDWIWEVAFSSDGRYVATASKDRSARVWDASTGNPVGEVMKHEHPVWSVAFSPNGKYVLTGSGSQDG